MGDREGVDADAVVTHQQPAAETLFIGVQAIAGRRLRDLPEERLNVSLHEAAEAAQAFELRDEQGRVHPQGSPADLRDRAHRERSSGHERHADNAFIADGGDLDDVAVGERGHQ